MTEDVKPVRHDGIAPAIAAAVGQVRKLGKADRNKFDGYDFVSIDKFLELVNPICAANGLFPWVHTDGIELYENTNSKGSKSTWARFSFHVTLHHASGQSIGPATLIVAVPMNGAQASGSAQSYALKQFFRGVFMIPTGDKDDADLNPTEQHSGPSNNRHDKTDRTDKTPGIDPDRPSAATIAGAVSLMENAVGVEDLESKWRALGKAIQADKRVLDAAKRRKTQLAAGDGGQPGPIFDDEVPY